MTNTPRTWEVDFIKKFVDTYKIWNCYDDCPAPEVVEDIKSFIRTIEDEAVRRRDEKDKILLSIIKDIKGYEPDGEVATLCDQAIRLLNDN